MNSNGNAAQLILQIIGTEMGLPAANLFLRDQNIKIPNDKGIYVVAGMVNSEVLSNQTYLLFDQDVWGTPGDTWWDDDDWWGEGPTGVANEVQALESIQIDFLSRSNDGVLRNWEVVAALQSITAIQSMEANSFKIVRLPKSFVNTSNAEGGSQLNRYSLTFGVFVWYRKTKGLDRNGNWFDIFQTRLDDEKTIGTDMPIAEFTINIGGIVSP